MKGRVVRVWAAALAIAGGLQAAPGGGRKQLFVLVDMEGASGITEKESAISISPRTFRGRAGSTRDRATWQAPSAQIGLEILWAVNACARQERRAPEGK